MKTCARCRAPISHGGKWDGPLRFCGDACLRLGPDGIFAVPPAQLESAVWAIHQGQCPRCGGRGPVDLHASYTIWSAVLFTRWTADVQLCCEPCGRSTRWSAAGKSLLLGWWGFPFGLLMTPVQVGRNVAANLRSFDPTRPSRELVEFVHDRLALDLVAAHVPEYQPGDPSA